MGWLLLLALIGLGLYMLAALKGGKKPAPAIEVTRAEPKRDLTVDDKDSWEGSFWDVGEPIPVTARLEFDYINATGQKSHRTAAIRQFGEYLGDWMLIGHCELRDATRTFLSSRMANCIDAATGEVIDSVPTYLQSLYEASPEFQRDRLYDQEFDTLRALLFVAKADGQYREAEKKIVRDFCRSLSGDQRVTDRLVDDLLSGMESPSLQAFRMAIGRIAKRDMAHRATVLNAATQIVGTQTTVHPAEQDALDYMRQRLAENPGLKKE